MTFSIPKKRAAYHVFGILLPGMRTHQHIIKYQEWETPTFTFLPSQHSQQNNPREYPNSNAMMGGFLRTGYDGRDMSTIHATLTPGGDWEINVKHRLRNPPKNFYEATAIWETNVKNSWRNPPQNFF